MSALEQYGLEDNVLAERMAFADLPGDLLAGRPLKKTLVWSADRGWMTWKDPVWSGISEPEAVEMVRAELQRYFRELAAREDATQKDIQAWSKLLTATKAKNVTYFLKGLLSVPPETWDSHKDLLNCLNGVVNLRTGDISAPDPALYMTRCAVTWNPNATHADWDTALEAVPEDVREWLQVRYGQALTGYPVDDDILPIQSGGGSNGKSTLVAACVAAAGTYGTYVPEKVLLASPGEHPTELMTLRGARLAVIEETPEGKHLPTKRLKDLVGTPVMTARAMRQDFVSWESSHSLFLNTNYVPQVSETDHGTWRRLALVQFPFKFIDPSEPLMAPNEMHGDPGLRERIRFNTDDQLEAVLAWMIEGARAWYDMDRRQLPVPLTVQDDTAAWRAETDLVLAFCMEKLTFEKEASVLTTELYEAFTEWLNASGRSVWNDQTFSQRFAGHELVQRNYVSKGRASSMAGITRRLGPTYSLPVEGKPRVWKGVRFN